ncbi:MAG: toprim domain-containing protein [Candidatus Moranbacteria bacterium]|nr:toprim domain-containing protein [Candidatus Moranbacteria bacterium]
MTFIDFCRAQGVVIDTYPPIGVWKRFKTLDKPNHRNGAVKFMGDHGFVRNWATDSTPSVWHEEGANGQAKPIDIAKVQAQRDRERQYRVQAVKSARKFWNMCQPLSMHHKYLADKGLSPVGCAGLRTHDGLLVIPVMYGPALISIQTITIEGVKRFWPGAPVKSGSFVLRRERSAITVLCEGLATGLAVFQSVRNASVVVCFDAGNLLPVTQHLKPTGSVVFMADNDHATKVKRGFNPGIDKATNAAELIGAGVAWCEGIEGTDAADFLKEVGEGAARKLERLILGKAKFVMT